MHLVAAALLASVAGAAVAHQDGRNTTSVAGVGKFPVAGGGAADGASLLTRTRDGVGFTLHTRGLAPNVPYTVWWVAFNNPRRCLVRCACGEADFANPRADIGVFWATGRFSDAHGQAAFSGQAAYGALPDGIDQVPFAPDFASPIRRGAEIHFVVRAHGDIVEDGEDQLTQFNGGCPPNPDGVLGGCVDVHFAVHRAPRCRGHN